MNIGNILKVADAIEQHAIPDLGFNMGATLARPGYDYADKRGNTDCGTIACIAGYCVALARGATNRAAVIDLQGLPVGDAGSEFLGIDRHTLGQDLFFGTIDTPDLMVVTPAQAVKALRILAITGKVNWAAAMSDAEPELPALPVAALAERVA